MAFMTDAGTVLMKTETLLPLRKEGGEGYVELHARSAFSFLEGSALPEALAAGCAAWGQSAMAIVDAHGVYGAPRFHMAAVREGIRALIGAEVESTEGGRYTLLAENRQGYQNLCRLITRTKLRHGASGKLDNPRATPEEFAEYAEGLVCLTGGQEGVLAQIFAQQRGPSAADAARKHLESLKKIYGAGNVYAELQRHHRRKEEVRNQAVVELARSFGLKLLATNGVSHAIEEQRELQDVLTCVRHKTTIAKAGRLLSYNAESHLKSSAEMKRLFADLPEAFHETGELAGRLSFTLA